ncbi:hypothetical protein L1277_002089 [Okibacterium sp. HSC-33S16]|nr:hypothetical protein [Okibacterium sp. HSC-33S16]
MNLFTTAPLAETIFDAIRAQSMRLQSPAEPRTLAQLDADIVVDGLIESFTGEFSTPDPTGTRIFGTGLGTYRYSTEPPTDTNTNTNSDADAHVDADADAGTHVDADAGAHAGSAAGGVVLGTSGATVYRVSCAGPGVDPVRPFRKIVPTVMVTVPVLTLLGQSVEPGNLDGYGPIDPQTARDLAAQAPEFHRMLTHPETGVVLSLGATKYTPSAAMRRFLRYRDGYCRFPGCNRRAVTCDIDHTDPFSTGGCTDIDNLASLCPKHHKMKHETQWQVQQLGNGTLKWTSPQGREYLTHPENPARGPIPPVATAKPGNGETVNSPSNGETMTDAQQEKQRLRGVFTRLDERLKKNRHRQDDTFDDGNGDMVEPNTPPF